MARPPAKVLRSSRFASRRKAVRRENRRRRRRVTIGVLFLAILGIGGTVLARSSLFALDGIEVRGTRLLARDTILRASGVEIGQNMMSIHPDQIATRLRSMPLVGVAKVERLYPSRLRITIVERMPSFVVETPEQRRLIDAGGMVLADATVTEVWASAPVLPTLRIGTEMAADTGDRARLPALGDALRLWDLLPGDLRSGAPVVDATTPAGLTLVRPELQIRFGSLDRIDEKLNALRVVLARAAKTGDHLSVIDVRAPSRPAALLA